MSIDASPDFSDLTSAEVADLYHKTRRAYITERDGQEEVERGKPKIVSSSGLHFANGTWCHCDEGLAAHAAPDERYYQSEEGAMVRLEPGEQRPLSREAQHLHWLETMPDSEVERLRGDDQAALREWRDARAEAIAAEFKDANPRYYATEGNLLTLVDYLASEHLSAHVSEFEEVDDYIELLLQRGHWTVKALSDAFTKLYKAGRLESAPGVAKPLNADDLRRLSALASGCRTDKDYEHVLQKYLDLSGIELSWREAAVDSVYSPIVEKAVIWVWEQAQDTYTPTPERRDAIRKYLAGRFPTVKLLNSAWLAVQKAEEHDQQEVTPASAPRLTEEEEKLQTAQAFANEIARASWQGL